MNAIQAKQIQIADYLHSQGINPKEAKGNNYWYCSPFRNERTASFKVDNEKNTWYDHGSGEGGNILDLVMKLHSIPSISGALAHLSGKTITTRPVETFSFPQQGNSNGFEEISVQPLTNPLLIRYLNERKINVPLAQQLCKEIHYKVKGKPYFAVGFENDKGDFALRNEYSKTCTSSDITFIDIGKPHCCVFEGFIDYLSFLSLKDKASIESNVVILNSVNNLNKATEFLKRHDTIYTFLDNDEAGRKCLNEICKLGKTISDQSKIYNGYKDLNDYLCGKKQVQQKQQKRGMKL